MKKLIAYSSIAHMGVVTIGIFHVQCTGHLRCAVPDAQPRRCLRRAVPLCRRRLRPHAHPRDRRYGGLAERMPAYAFVFMLFTLASMGLPGTGGFVGEFLVLVGAFKVNFWLCPAGLAGHDPGHAYMLWLYRRVIFGAAHPCRVARHPRPLARARWRCSRRCHPDAVDGRLSLQLHRVLGRQRRRHGGASPGRAGHRREARRSAALMNWFLALPEIVLACAAWAS